MRRDNGFVYFEAGDDPAPEMPRKLPVPHYPRLHVPYGFKPVTTDDVTWRWGLASEDDYRSAEARRLGIHASEVAAVTCGISTTWPDCAGGCESSAPCVGILAADGYLYCGCLP